MAGPDEKPAGSTTNCSWGEPLNRALGRASDAPLRTGNQLTLLRNGPETFDEWLEEIGGAERWIHLELFQFEGDRTGRRFAEAITQKAREGVRVRVLYDWLGSLMVPRSFWRELRRAGVEVRVVSPPALSSPLRVLERDHRKLLAVDGLYASTGGVSIADLWLERSSETGLPYRDTSVGVRGPAVADLEKAFAGVWDLSGVPLPREELPAPAEIPKAGEQDVRVIVQEPGKMRVLRTLELLTSAVDERMWIADAHFLSMATLTRGLLSASRDGVDVRILVPTPATNDQPPASVVSRTQKTSKRTRSTGGDEDRRPGRRGALGATADGGRPGRWSGAVGGEPGHLATRSRDRGDEPAVDLQRDSRDVRSGWGEQERRGLTKLRRFAVAAQGYAFAHLAALLLDLHARVSGPRLVERARPGGVDAPRRHAVDAYARTELLGEALDESRNARAQHVRGVEVLYRLAHRGGGDEEHGGALVHLRDQGAEQPHGSAYEQAEGVEPLLVAQLQRGSEGRTTSVYEHAVERAEVNLRDRSDLVYSGRTRNVRRAWLGPLAKFSRRLLQGVGVSGDKEHPCAFRQ
jgi:hypothetical protein